MFNARTLTVVMLLLITISLLGCFSSRPKDIEAFLKPFEADVTVERYALLPPDEVEIHCSKVPEIHLQRQQIRPDGKVSFEALGEIEAAGKTPDEVAKLLQEKASQLYSLAGDHPIDVRIVAYRSKMYYVMGEVSYPGLKVYTGRNTVLSALVEAVPTVLAWKERIQVIRPPKDKSGRSKIFEVNFDRMIAHGDMRKNVLLEEGDIIYVPPTVLAAIGQKVEEFVRPIGGAFSTVYIIQRTQTGVGTRR